MSHIYLNTQPSGEGTAQSKLFFKLPDMEAAALSLHFSALPNVRIKAVDICGIIIIFNVPRGTSVHNE